MADISITQEHELAHHSAKAAAQQMAEQLAAEYDMAAEWSGDVLLFKRDGVSGSLTLDERQATLEISLGGLFKVFAPAIEQKVGARMKKMFAATA